MVTGGATEFDSFIMVFKKVLLQLMTVQVNDLRSSIVKAACQTIIAMSERLGDAFEPFAEHFVPHLWAKTIVSIQVIAESAQECICSMIKHTQAPRLLQKVIEVGVSDKNALLRAKCLHFMSLILLDWSTPAIERSIDLAENAIRKGMADANGDARAAARRSFWAYKPRWPDRCALQRLRNALTSRLHVTSVVRCRANRVMAVLDGSTQRLLLEEEFGPSTPVHSSYTKVKKRTTTPHSPSERPRAAQGQGQGLPRSPTSASSMSGSSANGGDAAAWGSQGNCPPKGASRERMLEKPTSPVGRKLTGSGTGRRDQAESSMQTVDRPEAQQMQGTMQGTMQAPQGRTASRCVQDP